ncbi:phenylalanine--tRNA ligase subunit beta [Candidatus Daviesbacteria bacterium]|nr:phenylalanine--tRNA ligase subunit beta [Candidatus Daviesbacteria bacterium]
MKVSIDWLKELVEINDIGEVIRLLPLRTIGTKEETEDFIELDMKGYNRADLLSMRGVAYEVAAITDSKVKFSENESQIKEVGKINVEINNPKLCPIYCVAKIENLKVEQSSDAWVKKLSDSSLRSVNKIADITNLIMLEYGQPLHAFDASKVSNETIVVRIAKDGERITTLDGKTRDLETADLLIADPQNNLGIAGVMGGKDSEVSDSTSTILLEAAIFDPAALRATSTRLGISSEASKRFYHGLTKKRLFQALDAAIKMYQGLGGKLTALTIVGDFEDRQKNIVLTKEKLDSLIGVNIPADEVQKYLEKLHFALAHPQGVDRDSAEFHLGGESSWTVSPPYWRLDINIEEDLVEEVARMYGYEKIPAKELSKNLPAGRQVDQSLFELIYKIKTSLVNLGLTEIQTYSFYSTQIIENLQVDTDNLVKIANPISSETEYLRDNIWPNLLEKVAQNMKHGFSDIAVFEVGKVYQAVENNRPKETYKLSITLLNGSNNPIRELYQIFQDTLLHLPAGKAGLRGVTKRGNEEKYFHPTRLSFLEHSGKEVGKVAEVHPKIVNRFGVEKRIAVLEIEIGNPL